MTAARRNTADPEQRTVEVVAGTGSAVLRNWPTPDLKGEYGKPWREVLDIRNANLSRFVDSPVLVDHVARSANVIGSVAAASRQNGALHAKLRFGRGPLASEYLQDVVDGIRNSVSLGYTVEAFSYTGTTDGVRSYTATAWTPLELSLVPVSADPNAKVRNADDASPNPLLRREVAMTLQTDEAGTPALQNRAQSGATFPAPVEDRSEDDVLTRAVELERQRVTTITRTAAQLNLSSPADRAVIDGLVDGGVEATAARAQLINLAARRSQETGNRPRISVTGLADHGVSTRDAAVQGLAAKLNPNVKAEGEAARFARMSVLAIDSELARSAGLGSGFDHFGRSSFGAQTSSDFPALMSAAGTVALLDHYRAALPPLREVANEIKVPDFSAISRIRVSEGPELLKVNESGELTHASTSELAEKYYVETFGRVLAYSRVALVNDSLGGLSQWVEMAGRAAARATGDVLWKALAGSGMVLSDGKALFHADHGTVATAAELTVASLSAARAAMRAQKDLSGQPLGIGPATLVVGSVNETRAAQLSAEIAAAAAADVNAFNYLKVIVESRIDTSGEPNAWYLFAAKEVAPVLELAYLDGSRPYATAGQPSLDVEQSFHNLNLGIRVVHDVGAGIVGKVGIVKNAGLAPVF